MTTTTIRITNPNDATALQQIAESINTENLQFLAELSKKIGINDKIKKNKTLIKFYL